MLNIKWFACVQFFFPLLASLKSKTEILIESTIESLSCAKD